MGLKMASGVLMSIRVSVPYHQRGRKGGGLLNNNIMTPIDARLQDLVLSIGTIDNNLILQVFSLYFLNIIEQALNRDVNALVNAYKVRIIIIY